MQLRHLCKLRGDRKGKLAYKAGLNFGEQK